jgi:hypothetical protein
MKIGGNLAPIGAVDYERMRSCGHKERSFLEGVSFWAKTIGKH